MTCCSYVEFRWANKGSIEDFLPVLIADSVERQPINGIPVSPLVAHDPPTSELNIEVGLVINFTENN